MEATKQQSYRSIFKATSLFGGLQVYQIVIGIIRSKLIAIILGPSGMGISGLYVSAITLIKSMTSMGLSSSAVRDVSQVHGTGNQDKINVTITVLRKLVWLTGILGMGVVIFGSPVLSKSTFGSYEYIIPFIVLSISVLVDQLAVGQNVILQGTRRLKYLAQSSAIGSAIGLVVTIPIYYVWGVDGIVPTLVIVSFLSYLLAKYYANKVPYKIVKISLRETISNGKTMIKMGLAMSINGLLLSASAYLLRIFIMNQGGAEAVGLFAAGFAIVTTYVGMVFSAISTDYYPRLAAINTDNEKCRALINQEGEIGSLILGPCLVGCILFMPLIIRILYTDEFIASSDYVLWACLGMMFKLSSWVVAFIFIAKSAMKLFLINEASYMVYSLIFSIVGFYYDGLRGLGIAFSLGYFIYTILVYIIVKKKYGYLPSLDFVFVFTIELTMAIVALLITLVVDGWHLYLLGTLLLIGTVSYSLYALNKRINILNFFNKG